jgi:DNA-binding response OmpR family regulator
MTIQPTTVWLVDDDDDDLMLMEMAFQRVDDSVRLETMHDGEELIIRLKNNSERPSFILLDLNMDRLNGMHALREIRRDTSLNDLKIIVLTTSFNPDDRLRSEIMGANDFFVKPTEFEDLLGLIQDLLKQWVPQ